MTSKPSLFLCSCDNSQTLDAKAIAKALDLDTPPKVYEQLCRSQIGALDGIAAQNGPAVICCTQEAPVLMEAWEDAGGVDVAPDFVNIRETAGWSDEGVKATAKIAALIAETTAPVAATTSVSMTSQGRTLILGRDEHALQAAKRLAPHLAVTVCLETASDIAPPAMGEVPVFHGKVASASGHLGAFSVTFESLSSLEPSSRDAVRFSGRSSNTALSADIIVDLRGASVLFPAPEKRDGYLRPDIGNPLAVERTLFDALNFVGEFEKPQYVSHSAALCAHARNSIVACTRCVDVCPTSAIAPDGDHVKIDPYVCAGCGECTAVCPTGANAYQYPSVKGALARARALLGTYHAAKGAPPVMLVTDTSYGEEVVAMMARYGRGLPAHVVPFTLNSVTGVGLDILLSLSAYGASRVILLANPAKADEFAAVREQAGYANTILDGLGYGGERIAVLDDADPSQIEDRLWTLPKTQAIKPANFAVEGGKRETLSMALTHLHANAPSPQDRIALPDGAPFGAITIDAEGCTLCLSCTSACPAGALKSNPDRPELRFRENACVQCGLCRKTCPEKVITLSPGIDFTGQARNLATLKSEEPFECVSCGKPFGTKASIERMIDKLKDHPMFSEPGGLDRLKMCENCRVVAMSQATPDPFAHGTRPLTRTTDDYFREREAAATDDPKKLN
ncbi:4Fe-4S dicluster domain-containing protein [Magnetovibrio sp.]|uniref:4Fe-4S dicluster domain-containing protein n=1 Tax=Magnetovibrio sp. TaxID=2024836 RepID=UPI002F9240EB